MGSFGNYVGASFGDAYESAWVVGNYQDPKNESLLDANGKLIQLPLSTLPTGSGRYQPYKPTRDQLGRAASSDHNAWEEIEHDLHAPGSNSQGAHSLNWEGQSFVAMQKESNQLNPQELTRLAKLWRDGGNTLKTQSENFSNSVRDHISGKWSG